MCYIQIYVLFTAIFYRSLQFSAEVLAIDVIRDCLPVSHCPATVQLLSSYYPVTVNKVASLVLSLLDSSASLDYVPRHTNYILQSFS